MLIAAVIVIASGQRCMLRGLARPRSGGIRANRQLAVSLDIGTALDDPEKTGAGRAVKALSEQVADLDAGRRKMIAPIRESIAQIQGDFGDFKDLTVRRWGAIEHEQERLHNKLNHITELLESRDDLAG